MTIPANAQWEAAPYGAMPVYLVGGPQGGPYNVLQSGTATSVPISTVAADSFPDATNVSVARCNDPNGVVRMLAVHPVLYEGLNYSRTRTPFVYKDVNAVAVTAGTGFTAWTPAAGKKFRLMGAWLSSSAAAAVIFGDNAIGTVIFRTPLLGAAGVFTLPWVGNGVLSALANNVLKIDVSAGSTLTGCVFGTEE